MCIRDSLGVVRLLCAKGANVNRVNEEDTTPVHVAAQRGNTDIIKFFNSNGGDISRRNSAGEARRQLRLFLSPLSLESEKSKKPSTLSPTEEPKKIFF